MAKNIIQEAELAARLRERAEEEAREEAAQKALLREKAEEEAREEAAHKAWLEKNVTAHAERNAKAWAETERKLEESWKIRESMLSSTPRPQNIVDAIKEGSIEAICYFAIKGHDVNEITADGDTPLMKAIRCNFGDHTSTNFRMVQALVKSGAHSTINDKNPTGDTPLMMAVAQNQHEIVQLLTCYGADPMKQNANGDNCITLAAKFGYTKVLGALLGCISDLNAANKEGLTPLEIATNRGDIEAVKMLLKVSHTQEVIARAISSAIKLQDNKWMLHTLIVESKIDMRTKLGEEVLQKAINAGDIGTAEFLKLYGATLPVSDQTHSTESVTESQSNAPCVAFDNNYFYYTDTCLVLPNSGSDGSEIA